MYNVLVVSGVNHQNCMKVMELVVTSTTIKDMEQLVVILNISKAVELVMITTVTV